MHFLLLTLPHYRQLLITLSAHHYFTTQDLIGAPVETDDFVVGGTCTEFLFGACEALYKPNMVNFFPF